MSDTLIPVSPQERLESVLHRLEVLLAQHGRVARCVCGREIVLPADAAGGPFLTRPEAAELLRIGMSKLDQMLADGSLPKSRVGGRVLVRRDVVMGLVRPAKPRVVEPSRTQPQAVEPSRTQPQAA